MKSKIEITVKTKSGALDKFAMQEEFDSACYEYEIQHLAGQDKAAAAVAALFDSKPGERITRSTIISMASNDLYIKSGSNDLNMLPKFSEMVSNYIEQNVSEDPGLYQSKLFGFARGANGGTWRWSDVSEEKRLAIQESWNRLSLKRSEAAAQKAISNQ